MRGKKALFLTVILLATVLQPPLAISDPGWLAGWGYRVQITIDADDVDTELTHFPVLIKLSDSCGINSEDLTFIFDRIEGNSLKIAVTKSDGSTQLYVEVEYWNNVTENAFLWVSKSDWVISETVDTVLYLYYDIDQGDNTDYVGIPNSAVAENVWDEDFKFVSHMLDDPDNAHIRDSTVNGQDGTKRSATNPDLLTAGIIDSSQRANGNDYIQVPKGVLTSPGTGNFTLSCWIETSHNFAAKAGYIFNNYGTSAWNNYHIIITTNNKLGTGYRDGEGDQVIVSDQGPVINDGYPHHIAWVREGTTGRLYLDGVQIGADTDPDLDNVDVSGGTNLYLLAFYSIAQGQSSHWYTGDVDEIRVSKTDRSLAWNKAEYETGRDHLLYFGDEEEPPILEPPAYLFGAGFNASSPWVSLYWKTNLTDITLFEVQNSTDKISWAYLGSNTTAEYHDFEVVNGTQRYYRVRACNLTDAVWDNSTWTDIDFETVYFLEGAGGVTPALVAMGKYYAMAIILLILGVLIGLGMRGKR